MAPQKKIADDDDDVVIELKMKRITTKINNGNVTVDDQMWHKVMEGGRRRRSWKLRDLDGRWGSL